MKKGNHSHTCTINKQEYKFAYSCAGLNCQNKPNSILKIKYINKIGDFCKGCSEDLLQSELAELISKEES